MRTASTSSTAIAPAPDAVPFRRLFVWIVLFTLVTLLLAPGYGGDSQIYHLPNIANMLKSGSIVGLAPEHLYRPAAATTYYPRGFEALCALFFLLPFSTPLIILFKFALFTTFWLMLRRESRNPAVETGLFALLLSMDFIRHDLANLKNDLVMAIPLVYAAVTACAQKPSRQGTWSIPLACAAALTLRANAIVFSVPVLLIWLWRYRKHFWRCMLGLFGIVLPFGLFFYWVNLVHLGNPLYPFEIRLGEWVVFPGRPNHLFHTTIMANLDRSLPFAFVRGLLRAAGPIGALTILSVPIGIGLGFRRIRAQGRRSARAAPQAQPNAESATDPAVASSAFHSNRLHFGLGALVVVLWTLVFMITPYSDHNAGIVHNNLSIGATFRMALPALLLGVAMLSGVLGDLFARRPAKLKAFCLVVGIGAVVNLFWYDAAALAVKPENALALWAQAVRSFNLATLFAWLLVAALLCLPAVRSRKRWPAVALVIAAIAIQQVGYPQSLGHTIRFKQLGQPSDVFTFFAERGITSADRVAIHSADESSFFLACLNDQLLPRAGRMFFLESLDQLEPDSVDWLILCAKDVFDREGPTYGRQYRASWDYLQAAHIPEGFNLVFSDGFYQVFRFVFTTSNNKSD